jgi:3-oxoadipate enol-lactonase
MPIIKANSINIYYEIYGAGEPLVFVAGFSGNHTAWRSIVQHYVAQYQVIIFDNRGIGRTDCPDCPDAPHHLYTTEMMADDTAELLRALQQAGLVRPGKAHFIGHSFGGCIVQMVARRYPELVQSIILACTFTKFNVRGRLYAEARLELIKAGAPEASIVKFITLLCWSRKYLAQPGMVEALVRGGFFPITIKGYEGQMHAAATFDSRAWVHEIKCPCLVLSADDDILATVEDGEYLCHSMPHAEFYCFKDVGHVPFIEQPELFNQLVCDFIRGGLI